MAALEICEHREHDGWIRLRVLGPINRATAATLRERLTDHLTHRVRLDLGCCTGIDLDGLLALAVAHDSAAARGGALLLGPVPPLIGDYVRSHNMGHLLAKDPPPEGGV